MTEMVFKISYVLDMIIKSSHSIC